MPETFSHRPPRQWLQIDLTLPVELVDYVGHELTRITGCGVQMISHDNQETIIAYLEKDRDYAEARRQIDALVADLNSRLPQALQPSFTTLLEENWAENWKENYRPSRITETITVKPTWQEYCPGEGEIVIAIDPGMAFGTGLHSSTRLALTYIDQLYRQSPHQPRTVLDVGTGTAILALAAAKLGAQQVVAIDNDIDAVAAARENIKQNHETGRVVCSATDLADLEGNFDLVIANITVDVLTELSAALVKKIAAGGHLILAGILGPEQARRLTRTLQDSPLTLIHTRTEENWYSLLLQKSS